MLCYCWNLGVRWVHRVIRTVRRSLLLLLPAKVALNLVGSVGSPTPQGVEGLMTHDAKMLAMPTQPTTLISFQP
jgi:hypothetical protein